MASLACWKCPTRPSMLSGSYYFSSVSSRCPSWRLSFSTSMPLEANRAIVKGSKQQQNAKAGRLVKTLRIKKKAVVKTGRPPAPGERKAFRKRIVLSNPNALEISSLTDMTSELDSAQIGAVFRIQGPLIDQLRAVEAFKTTQAWGLFRHPAVLIREESVEIERRLQAAHDAKKTLVTIIDGEQGSGKSLMLLQSMATAFLKGWIVLNIPEAQELTMALTDYSPIAGTTPTLYSQNSYTAKWLGQIAKSNNNVLSKLQLAGKHSLPSHLQPDTSLARLVEIGARDPEIAWPIFQAFWSEITSANRPPVLMTLDGLHHIMTESAYRSSEYELIHAHDLAIVRHFLDYLSGAQKLPNGGAVLAATTKSNTPASYATTLAIQQQEERQAGQAITKADPYKKIDMRAHKSLQAASVMRLKGLSKAEARGLMEYWAASGVLRQRVDEKTVTERWAVAGNGIVGQIEKGALRTSIQQPG